MYFPSILRGILPIVLLSMLTAVDSQADLGVALTPDGQITLNQPAAATTPEVRIFSSADHGLSLDVLTTSVLFSTRYTEQGEFQALSWRDAGPSGEIGSPALPVVRRLFIAPNGATVTLSASVGSSAMLDESALGFPIRIMPRQAPVPKLPGALEQAPFAFDDSAYTMDTDYLAEPATIEELGIARGRRLFLLEVHPVAYNPLRGTLEFRNQIQVDVTFAGGSWETALNPLPGFADVVLNPESLKMGFRSDMNYLIITTSEFQAQAQQFATQKQSKGFSVTTYITSSSSATAIKSHIQSLWGTANAPDYILLIGDTEDIGYFTGGGEGNPSTDLPYTCMDGTNDWYPDICIGRFPVDDPDELNHVLAKTISFDNGEISDPGYFDRAVFMASEDNYTVSEGTHNWVISNYMNPNGIVSDKLYCHTYNATTQQVRNAFNAGRFYGIYSGHGGTYSWADGPVFSQSDVNGLTNAGMYSFVLSFACITGTYTVDECFTETWLLAENKGAVGIWGSSVNSYWTEDDVLEKRWFDTIYDDTDDVPPRFGPVFNEARMRYLAEMGTGSTTRRYFEMYNLMGDPGLPILEIIPPALTINLPQGAPTTIDPGVPTTFTVSIEDGAEQYVSGSGVLCYRYQDGGAFQTASLTSLGGTLYQATLPAAACADSPEFYIRAAGDGGATVYEPKNAPQSYYSALVGELIIALQDNFNTDLGWTVENSATLTAGAWQRGIPVGGGLRGDPPTDYDGSGYCFLTGNASGDSDVDGGYTWLISPTLDLSEGDAEVHYALWYTNDFGGSPSSDYFKTYVSNDNGANWILAQTIGPQSLDDWTLEMFKVSDFVTPNATVKVRFEASDLGSGSVVEAAVDAFEVVALHCEDPSCPGDLDGDNDVDVADLAQLLAHYGMTSGAQPGDGDLDGDGDVDISDLAMLLSVYGQPC